jgi:ketosteroid isomerase-like protein
VAAENVELVETALAAWNRGELDVFGEIVAEDIVWLEVSGWLENQGQEVRGREVLIRNHRELLDAWETYRLELQETHALDDQVIAVVREVGRGRASGVEVDGLWGYVITISDGKLARVEAYRDPEKALAKLTARAPQRPEAPGAASHSRPPGPPARP